MHPFGKVLPIHTHGPWQPCESSLSSAPAPPARPPALAWPRRRRREWSSKRALEGFRTYNRRRYKPFEDVLVIEEHFLRGWGLPPSFLCSTLTIFGHTFYVFTFFSFLFFFFHFARMRMPPFFLCIFLCMHMWVYFLFSSFFCFHYRCHCYKIIESYN